MNILVNQMGQLCDGDSDGCGIYVHIHMLQYLSTVRTGTVMPRLHKPLYVLHFVPFTVVHAGTEDGGMESSLTGSQESLYAAEDSSMEVDYSSSDKVLKT
jgi:hypothetical protein